MRNCPNCGSPIDYTKNRCEYCGTPYFDLSLIPIHKPFLVKLQLDTKHYMVVPVVCEGVQISCNPSNSLMYVDGTSTSVRTQQDINIDIQLWGNGNADMVEMEGKNET